MKQRAVTHVGVKVRETGDIYLTTMAAFYDRRWASLKNDHSGMIRRFVPFSCFRKRAGQIRL